MIFNYFFPGSDSRRQYRVCFPAQICQHVPSLQGGRQQNQPRPREHAALGAVRDRGVQLRTQDLLGRDAAPPLHTELQHGNRHVLSHSPVSAVL